MRVQASIRLALSASRFVAVNRVVPRAPVIISAARPLSTTAPLSKKSKAAASKKSHKAAKEDADGNPESSRYDKAPEADLNDVLEKTERKMEKAVDWARGLTYDMVERGRGRVTPSLLDSVKVSTPDVPGSRSLNNVASVTTKGSALLVSVWDSGHTKFVESAIHEANLPGISPSRINETTLKIPISRPTHEQRQELLKQIGSTVETAKNQVRHARTDGMNSLGGRGETGSDEVQKLANDFGGNLDQLLTQAKKEFEKA